MLPSQFQLASIARAMLPYLSYHLRPPGLSSWPLTPTPHTGVGHKPLNLTRTVSPRSLRSGSKRVPVLLSRAQEVSATGARAVVRATPNTKHDNHSGMPVKYRPRIRSHLPMSVTVGITSSCNGTASLPGPRGRRMT